MALARPQRRALIIFLAGFLVLLAALAAVHLQRGGRLAEIAAPSVGGPFALTDQEGRRVTQASYAGRHLLVFFGFTHCPDVCPLALGEVSAALDALGAEAAKVQPLFVTVDPARDTPAALKDYLTAVDDRVTGLTGTAEEIAAIARGYRVYYKQVPVQGALGYTMDHSAFVYLVAPDGRLATFFTHETKGEQMAKKIREALAKG